MSDYIGQQFGSYRLVRKLGQGGFSDVYLGEHVYLKTQAAVKILETRLEGSSLNDFVEEARTIARLDHPHIVRVLDFGVRDNTPFLIMVYAPNGTLRLRYPKGSVVPLTAVVSYTKQITSALQYAHNEKIIHRDVKPENILLGRNNEVLLSDFGIAIIAQSTIQQDAQGVVGTVAYMAPEQIQGRPRPASDQYALAVIVYEWLSGDRPFRGGFTELCAQHMFAPPPPLHEKFPGIHPAIEQVVQKALAKEPHQRFASMEQFANALEEAVRVASHQVSPPISVQPLPPSSPLPIYRPAVASSLTPPPASLPVAPREVSTQSSTPQKAQPIPTVLSTPPSSSPPITPLPPTVPEYIPTPPQPPTPTRRRVSRRTALVGLGITGLVVAAGGVAGFELFSHSTGSQSGRTPTPNPTPTNIGKLVSTYSGHTSWVATVAWSPDSTLVASGSNDHTVQILNAINGNPVLTYNRHHDVVSSVAWSHNGKIASGGADRSVQVWDPVSGNLLLKYPGPLAQVRSVVWSPGETYLAIGGYDNMVHVWNVPTGNIIFTYRGHTKAVYGVAWSPDGTRIASASLDGTVQVWNATDGSQPLTYPGHYAQVRAVAWSPDGTYIASGGDDKKVQVWNAATGNPIFTYTGHKDSIESIAWSLDSQRIASGSGDKSVHVWDALTGHNSFVYHGHRDVVYAVAWSGNGKYIASGGGNYLSSSGGDTTVQVWQAS
jgi:eukaryotic-like serine/threonine-protein kinase